ncbi:MAG TPA: pyridoxamine 5'-phosphate oxidase family protein [Acidimicrobiales bacterium]|nr:pyridoxamine 5'-phosphate oxidase family protein [Acidimicrobiales bacterium]
MGSNRPIDPLTHPLVAGVLAEGRQAYVTVAASGGPHVTPELYAVDGGRLWFFAAAGTLKARLLPRRPSVAVLVRAGGRAVAMVGEVAAFHPAALPPMADVLRAPAAVARYSLRNAVDLAGFASDLARGRLGWRVPQVRVLFSVRPTGVALLDGFAVREQWGSWPGSCGSAASTDVAQSSAAVGAVVALGWGDGSLLALPGRWHQDDSRAQVPTDLLALAAAPSPVDAAVVVDDYGAPGPAAKRGVMLRGSAVVEDDGWLTVDADRTVLWDGIETGTVKATG